MTKIIIKCSLYHVLGRWDSLHQINIYNFCTDPRVWSRLDVLTWLQHMKQNVYGLDAERFRMNGKALCLMTPDMFAYRVPNGGLVLYKDFQMRLCVALARQHHADCAVLWSATVDAAPDRNVLWSTSVAVMSPTPFLDPPHRYRIRQCRASTTTANTATALTSDQPLCIFHNCQHRTTGSRNLPPLTWLIIIRVASQAVLPLKLCNNLLAHGR